MHLQIGFMLSAVVLVAACKADLPPRTVTYIAMMRHFQTVIASMIKRMNSAVRRRSGYLALSRACGAGNGSSVALRAAKVAFWYGLWLETAT